MKIWKAMAALGVLAVGSAATPSLAEELTSDEIVRRIQIQQGAAANRVGPPNAETRGLAITYGAQEPTTSAVEAPLPAFELQALPAVPAPTYQSEQPVILAPGGVGYVETQPLATVPLAANPVSIDSYQPVQEDARIDLRIFFEWNSASLKPEAISQLSVLCSALSAAVGQSRFRIIGHTDKSGSSDYNLYLSRARAREVKRHLVEECAIPSDTLIATGEGERQSNPGAPDRDPSERRVEVQVVS